MDAAHAGLRERFPEAAVEVSAGLLCDDIVVDAAAVHDVLQTLRDDEGLAFDVLADVSAVDWLPRTPRYDLNYHLYSLRRNVRVRVKVRLDGPDPAVASCVDIWPTANWQEREVYDLMGVSFTGHPDLRRIIMPDEWIGHPHRKDYPLGGVPVEYKIEPAYIGADRVSTEGRASMGGAPPRARRDRAAKSPWTWTGPPAAEIRRRTPPVEEVPVPDDEPKDLAP